MRENDGGKPHSSAENLERLINDLRAKGIPDEVPTPTLDPGKCDHTYLRCDKPWRTGEYDADNKEILVPQFTCFHPSLPHCGTSLTGKERIEGYNKAERIAGRIYFIKEEKTK